MHSNRKFNFSAGPSCQPVECLEQVARDLLDWQGTGLSVSETSHRTPIWSAEMADARDRLRRLLKIPESYAVLFVAGGATLQFSAIPFNFLGHFKAVDYFVTGKWSRQAYDECVRLNFPGVDVNLVCPLRADYESIPDESTWNLSDGAAYCYVCSNETVHGIQFKKLPKASSPLIIDMSSDFLSRPIDDWTNIGCIYAAAQKNFGFAGMSVVVVRKDLLERPIKPFCPLTLDLRVQSAHESMYNTPPTVLIHYTNIVLKWIEDQGGVEAIHRKNQRKAAKLYAAIDESPIFEARVDRAYRSEMNVTFFRRGAQKNAASDAKFLAFCEKRNLVTLKGHPDLGGFRASIYNAMSEEGVDELVSAIEDFNDVHRLSCN